MNCILRFRVIKYCKNVLNFQMRLVGFNQDPCVRQFGISVSEEFEKVPARILDAPKLEYHQKVVSNSK